jgi:hypothetical protein
MPIEVILKRFENPDEVREFTRGRFELVSGRATVSFDDGKVWELTPGSIFYVPPEPHDSWVLGDEPYVSLHFLGARHYAK